jgi:predicted amidohydrolase
MIKIALAQMDVKWADPDANLAVARQMVGQASDAGADLVVLPELWGSGYDLARAAEYATLLSEGLFREMGLLARAHDLHVVGSLLEARDGQIYNTCALFGSQGLVGRYRKIHRFCLMQEDRYLAAGDRPALCNDTPWGMTALAICYDLRFPELFRTYALAGARLMVLPAQWPAPRVDHWRTLLRARAIENQCVVAGCNRVGADRDNVFSGASAVIGPWGEVLVEGGDQVALLVAEVDFDGVDEARQRIPILSDRRPECYGL